MEDAERLAWLNLQIALDSVAMDPESRISAVMLARKRKRAQERYDAAARALDAAREEG